MFGVFIAAFVGVLVWVLSTGLTAFFKPPP
jgi:hypothetical protein